METRHFMDDEQQITITVSESTWEAAQKLANETAISEGWLNNKGSNWDHLNIWIIRQLSQRPSNIDKNEWIKQSIN